VVLSYRGDQKDRCEDRGEQLFHVIERFDATQLRDYRAAGAQLATAFDRFAVDFERRFTRKLAAGPDARLRVARVVLVAETWTESARRVIAETLAQGFDRARLEGIAKHKYVDKVLKDPEAYAFITSLDVVLRQASPASWLEPLPSTTS
jgi:hypothetical protein